MAYGGQAGLLPDLINDIIGTPVLDLDAGIQLSAPAAALVDLAASIGNGASLVLADGKIWQTSGSGSVIDVGLNVGSGSASNQSIINVNGSLFGRGTDGSLVDLDLNVGAGGLVTVELPVLPGDDGLDVFRFFNVETGVHFYTANSAERDQVDATLPQFQYEGVAFEASQDPNDGPEIFRFYNEDTGTHFYTASQAERDTVIATLDQYNFEGVAYTAFADAGGGEHQALYRFYNSDTGAHFYTANDAERDQVSATLPQYQYEGVAYYVDVG